MCVYTSILVHTRIYRNSYALCILKLILICILKFTKEKCIYVVDRAAKYIYFHAHIFIIHNNLYIKKHMITITLHFFLFKVYSFLFSLYKIYCAKLYDKRSYTLNVLFFSIFNIIFFKLIFIKEDELIFQ